MEEEARGGSQRHVTSEETKASWRETVQLHLHLRDEEEDEEDEGDEEEGGSEVETSDGESQLVFLFPVRSAVCVVMLCTCCVVSSCCVSVSPPAGRGGVQPLGDGASLRPVAPVRGGNR